MFFFKKIASYAYPVSNIIYNQESQFLLIGSGTATSYSPLNTKFSVKYFNIESIQFQVFETISKVMPKNTNQAEKKQDKF